MGEVADVRQVLDVIADGLATLFDFYGDEWNLPMGLPAHGALAVWEKLTEAGIEFRFKTVETTPTATDAACGCPCHQVVRPGLVPCPRCEQETGRP